MAQFQEVSVADYITFARHTIVTFHHVESLLVTYQHDFRIILFNQRNGSRMVRFHVIDDQIIDLAVTDHAANLLQILFKESHIYRVHQRYHVIICNQIRIV